MEYDISSLLKHSGDMILVDEVKEYGEDFISVNATIKEENPFLQDGVLPNFVFLEIIAQSVSAFAGLNAKNSGKEVVLSLLLGCRNFQMYKDGLEVGASVNVWAKVSTLEDDGFGVYDCKMYEGDFLVAKGRLNVYTPNENPQKEIK